MTKNYVYAIGLEKDLVEPYSNCYVGVTIDIERRWQNHTKSRYTVGSFIREYNLTFQKNMIIIFSGDEESCYLMEEKYRPFPNIGLNEAKGGFGGTTKITLERNKKISKKLKGIPKSEEHKRKLSESRKTKNISKGSNNPNAKKWLIVSPSNDTIIVEGNLEGFCKENKLLSSCLRYYRGTQVPPLSKGIGGFRAKNDESKKFRENTIGWKLLYND
jgi:predicted GIY-YIG superfamily endonuclease